MTTAVPASIDLDFQIVYVCAFVSFYSDKPPSSVRNVLGMVNVNTDWLIEQGPE